MAEYSFVVGMKYSRRDVYEVIGLPPETKGGNWETGYTSHNEDTFIFANVGSPGRSGHDYPNKWLGDKLEWYGKTNSKVTQPSIQRMLSGSSNTFIFWRESDRAPFEYAGVGRPQTVYDESPVRVVWTFGRRSAEPSVFHIPEEVGEESQLFEGAVSRISVNRYERNSSARSRCIRHYGTNCMACGFNFEAVYGSVGTGFIHVHHLVPISTVGIEYELDPIQDLVPVCANCHAILHRTNPPLTIDELRALIGRTKEKTI